jgi:hypothetical protein
MDAVLASTPLEELEAAQPRLAPDNAQLFGAQVENIAGAPVMRVRPAGRAGFVLDLEQGVVVRVDAEAAREIALATPCRSVRGRWLTHSRWAPYSGKCTRVQHDLGTLHNLLECSEKVP